MFYLCVYVVVWVFCFACLFVLFLMFVCLFFVVVVVFGFVLVRFLPFDQTSEYNFSIMINIRNNCN